MINKLGRIFKNPFKNLYALARYDLCQKINEIDETNTALGNFDIKNKILIAKIQQYFDEHPELSSDFQKELLYLKDNPNGLIFPYKQLKRLDEIKAGLDESRHLLYVIHEGKKLFFPEFFTIDRAVSTYRNFIEKENILGGGYKEKSPHQYETKEVHVNTGDVLLDIGCAEALFSLHVIDKIKRVYLVESDKYWTEALNATFEPYKDKVVIINKLIADADTDSTITLASILKNESSSSIFLKMDIEGHETTVLKSTRELLSADLDLQIVCCAYHKHNDAAEISEFFSSLGYYVETSEGYMLFIFDELHPPYFRKGIIRAKKTRILHA